jgi:Flp pilus assembly protein TadB
MINFLILVIGFVFIYRTISNILVIQKFPEAFLKLFFKSLVYFNLMISGTQWFTPTYLVAIAVFLEIILLQNLELLFNLYLKHKFEAELIKFIDEIILTMSTGRSFRDAFVSICQQNESYFTKKILEIQKSSQLNTNSNCKNWQSEPKFLDLWLLFQSLEQNTHKQLEKLRAYRRQIHWEQNFRRKSAQATSQVKAQAFVLSALYIALLIYVLKTTGGNIIRWILISLVLYLTGLLSLYILGKRKPWKT